MSTVKVPKINQKVLAKLIDYSFSKVYLTMTKVKIQYEGSFTPAQLEDHKSPFYKLGAKDPLLVGSAGFTGAANGLIYQYLEAGLGSILAKKMTGLSIEDIREEGEEEIVNDVIGELTNMTVGTFKNALCDIGYSCTVTLPTVLRGNNMGVHSSDKHQRYLFKFTVEGVPLIADLFIEPFEHQS